MMKRIIKNINSETSAMGMGCWAIGGEWDIFGSPAGWGKTDDDESLRTISAAYDGGIRLFDTAANYGTGHSEILLGRALGNKRKDCVISTKFGFNINSDAKSVTNYGASMEKADVISHLKADCEASLKRLGTDYIDVYFFHIWDYDKKLAQELIPALENLVVEGKIRSYGWSTDNPELVRLWEKEDGFSSVQINFNVAADAPEMLELCESSGIAAFNRGPLAMGFLTGKYNGQSVFSATDTRNSEWVQEGFKKPVLAKLDQLREVLSSGGRTMAQGALAWIWAKSPVTFPIPGMRTVKQAEENSQAMEFGPLSADQLRQVEEIMER